MKYFFVTLIVLVALISCKRVQKDDTVYLAFRNSDTDEILFTEEIEVQESKANFMIIKSGSSGNVSYLEKQDGFYTGDLEIFRWNTAFINCQISLERKTVGRILMKGDFHGISQSWYNGQFTGTETAISGELELLN